MRVDTAIRIWLGSRPGLIWAPLAEDIFDELSEKLYNGRFTADEVKCALNRAGYNPRQQRYKGEEGWALALPE